MELTSEFVSGIILGFCSGIVSYFAIKMFFEDRQTQIEKDSSAKIVHDEGRPTNCKLIIAVRTDVKMGLGKVATQCADASVAALRSGMTSCPNIIKEWQRRGEMKVTVKVNSEEQMDLVIQAAREAGINTNVIHDASFSQIESACKTVAAIGPASTSVLNLITGHLKLY